jgi:hypothetical protein
MLSWLKHLDQLLRGRATHPDLLQQGAPGLPLGRFFWLAVLLGAVYGFFMGWFAVASRDPPTYAQVLASAVKLPALFLLTLVVTFPSLYVFSALTGCRLSFLAVLRLLAATIVVNLAVAASMGPILGFFTLSTKSYAFMVVLNVALLAVAGCVGLGFLLQTLRRLAAATAPPPVQPHYPTCWAPSRCPRGGRPTRRRPTARRTESSTSGSSSTGSLASR